MRRTALILLALGGAWIVACNGGKPQEEVKKPAQHVVTNPNGMSEMSLIMEEWYNAMLVMKSRLEAGTLVETAEPIKTAEMATAQTSKQNIHGEMLDGFTESFVLNYQAIAKGKTIAEQSRTFNLAVVACINCHEQYCQGPIVRIKKLSVKL